MTVRRSARAAGMPRLSRGNVRLRRLAAGFLGSVTAVAMLSTLAAAPSAAEPAAAPTTRGTADDAASAEPAPLVETEGEGTGLWVVELEEPSLATYTGDIAGLEPTSPQITGADRLNVDAPASRAYLAHLDDRQDDFRADIDRALGREVEVEYEYRNVINGLAVRVDNDEAERLTTVPGIAAIYRDVERELLTDVSHDLIRSASIWNGATAGDGGTRGEGVLVGIIDGGINPHHPSFAATDGEGYTHTNPFGPGSYVGVCDPDHPEHEDICNDKLVGAWNLHPSSPSAQDVDGHGSHTASTAAGNVHEATATIGSGEFTRTVQGVAPHANVISYLVCAPSCPGTSNVAAVEQAIEDGVDVLNYSISGADAPWADIVDRAFLEAFNAGIFVAASAGNSGPGASTVAHTGPWNAAVAATTHNRAFVNTLDATGPAPVPAEVTGLPAAPGTGPAAVADIEAEIRDAAALAPGNAMGCQPYPAGTFEGALALIDRGSCEFVVKVSNAADAGAVAVIVANNTAGPPTAMGALEDTTIPAVMIEQSAGVALRAFMADQDGGSTARLGATTTVVTDHAWEDIVAGFSSRGPSQLDLLAPTFAAPGVDILAAGAARDGNPNQYLVNSGTSMSSPHAAGAGALLTALHPDWSPAEIRSALASSADTDILQEDGTTAADPFDIGSGRIDLDSAGRIGLVLDETYSDFLAADPAAGGDPSSLNLPSLVDATCVETCSWTRTVRNVAAVEATYMADVTAPEGLSITVEPAEFTIAPGATQTVEISANVDLSTLTQGQPAFAELGFSTSAAHATGRPIAAVHYPVVVTPREQVPPTLEVDPGSVTSTQRVDEVAGHTLTLGNGGNTELLWELHEDAVLRQPRGASTEVATVEPPASLTNDDGDSSLAPAEAAGDGDQPAAVIPEREAVADSVTQTVTQSASQAVVAGNAIACTPDDGVTTSANAYLRTFTLADFGIDSEFDVTKVEFGIEGLTAEQELTVNLYTLIEPDAPLTYDNLEPIGSGAETFAPQSMTLATLPVTGLVEAGSTLVVELSAPDMSGTGGFWPGTNRAGQSAPSYIVSADCGIAEPADLAAIGFPYSHLVMNVTGTTDAPACDAPGDLPWLGVTPRSGTVGPDATGKMELTFDSTGVDPSTLTATLCLRTNDPDHSVTTVPLAVTVIGDGDADEALHTELTADGLPDDQTGNTVAIDGDTAVVGAFLADVGEFSNSGAAYVYTRTDDGWLQQATLLPPDGERDWGLLFGRSVAVDGDTIVVGATGASFGDSKPGAAYVFVRDGETWSQQAKLGTNEVRWGAQFGMSVDIDGDTVAVGVSDEHVGANNVQGVAYTFVRDGDTWSQGQRLVASDGSSFSNFGTSVRLDGDTMVIGAPNATAKGVFRQGAAYVFTLDGDEWAERAQLLPSDPAPELSFGTAVDIDADTVVVGTGGPGFDWLDSVGAAYVYTADNGAAPGWTEQARLTPADGHLNNRFGWSVAIDGGTVVIGAPYQGTVAGVDLEKGAATVFTRERGGWIQQRTLIAPDTAQGDHLGTSVAVSGDDVLVGAPNATVGDDADQGTAYVFVPGEDAPASPAMTITPGELAAEVSPGGTATEQLTVSNSGAQDLHWEIDTESTVSGPLRPAGTATAVETPPAAAMEPQSDGGSTDGWVADSGDELSSSTQGSAEGPAEEPAADAVRLTHSASMEVVESGVPVCANNQTGNTRENRFLRTFTLADFGIEGAFDVSEVTFGVQLVAPAADLTVNLYTLDGAFEYLNLTRLVSETVRLENAQETLITVPIPARVPAGSTLVMEVVAPDMEGVGHIIPGANNAGQTAPSYISADDCGAANPATMESLGFPDAHLVMAVDGTPLEPISCELPEWLALDPRSGTVAPGDEGVVDVTFDTAGLQAGEHAAHLCVTSNDPTARVTTVPVSLTVAEPSGDPVLSVETYMERGIWYAELSWTGVTSELVDVERDGRTVATTGNTGSYTDNVGRPMRGVSFTYRVCEAGTDTCSEAVVVYPRGELRVPPLGRPDQP